MDRKSIIRGIAQGDKTRISVQSVLLIPVMTLGLIQKQLKLCANCGLINCLSVADLSFKLPYSKQVIFIVKFDMNVLPDVKGGFV